MKKEPRELAEMMLVGVTVRTNNTNEMNQDSAKIAGIVQSYYQNNMANNIKARKNPEVTYSVYTDYESDHNGDYSYFIGEQVDTLDEIDQTKFTTLVIPNNSYQKFTTNPGPMPAVVFSAWQDIWNMTPQELGGKRNFLADFEVYDQRAADLTKAVLDIYIGIEPSQS